MGGFGREEKFVLIEHDLDVGEDFIAEPIGVVLADFDAIVPSGLSLPGSMVGLIVGLDDIVPPESGFGVGTKLGDKADCVLTFCEEEACSTGRPDMPVVVDERLNFSEFEMLGAASKLDSRAIVWGKAGIEASI